MFVRLLVLLAVLAAACASDGGHGVSVTGPQDGRPEVSLPSGEPPSELVVEDLRVGEGAEIADGTRATFHYVGVSWTTKTAFDSSWERTAFPVTVGGGEVIDGWDQGLAGMRVGGRRLLIIPPDLGYGPQGAGDLIPPNDTLVFVVDALEIVRS